MIHRVVLSNGRVLLLEEGTDELSVIAEDQEIFGGFGNCICILRDSGVHVAAADVVHATVVGLRYNGSHVEPPSS